MSSSPALPRLPLHLLACHPSSGLLRPTAEVLTQETDLLLPLVVLMVGGGRRKQGSVGFESLNVAIGLGVGGRGRGGPTKYLETFGLAGGNGFILTPVILSIQLNSETRNVVKYPRSCWFQAQTGQRH